METINNINVSNATAPVKSLLDNLIKSQESSDIQLFAKCFAHDENTTNIGTDLDEIWYGWNAFNKWMTTAFQNKPNYTIAAKDTRIQMGKNGDIAWYSQLLDTCIETKGEPFRLEGFRHTGVVEKRDHKWLIVQSHISIPDNTSHDVNR